MTVLTTIESEQAEPITASAGSGPGAMLRKERLAQGLDQSRAGTQLHLSDAMIEALETDDFATLPGPVFTQGYLRNYARLLGISENEVLNAYHHICPQADTGGLKAREPKGVMKEVRSSNRVVQLVTWLIVFGLLALLGIWWQDRLSWQAEPVVDDRPDSGTVSTTPRLMEDEPALQWEAAETASSSSSADQTIVQDSTQNARMQPDLTGVAAPPESPAGSEPPAQDKITLVPPVEVPVPPPPAIEQAPQPSAIQQQATSKTLTQTVLPEATQTTAANAQMVFEFTGRCWAEVRDSTGKAHIIGEMGAGDRRAVAANLGPFKIVLGNIKAVRLTIGGKPFDLTSQTRGVVARFKLDPSQL